MKRIAEFEKVSYNQFALDMYGLDEGYEEAQIRAIYDNLKLPQRATSKAAGYDMYAPFGFRLDVGESVMIPTGIRVQIEDGWWLGFYPRSGLGSKYRLQIDNTIPVIDGDYYFTSNEGHIFIKLTNDGKEGKSVSVDAGGAFCQGIFHEYGITYSDNATAIRTGGFGSTDQNDTYHQMTMDEYMSEA